MTRFQMSSLVLAVSVISFARLSFAEEKDSVEATPIIAKHAYPTAILQRPFTLPAGTGEIGAKMKLGVHHDEKGDKASDMVSLDWVHANFGVTRDFQLGVGWGGFQIPKVNPSKSLSVNAGYFLGANKYGAAMAFLDVPFQFNADIVRNISFALPTAIGVVKDVSFLAFYDSLIDFGFGGKKYNASFNFPLLLGYQITPSLYVDVSTRIAKFGVGEGMTNTYFWNSAPVRVKGLYAITNAFDVLANVGFDDVYNAKDTFSVILGLQYRMGNLDG